MYIAWQKYAASISFKSVQTFYLSPNQILQPASSNFSVSVFTHVTPHSICLSRQPQMYLAMVQTLTLFQGFSNVEIVTSVFYSKRQVC
jgi:hypothetical protein